jgi:hypothetical protein
MKPISLTMFKNRFDSKTNKRMDFDTFDALEKLLYELSSIVYKAKEDAPLISPATYVTDANVADHDDAVKESNKTGTAPKWYHRKNRNAVDWGGWAALDVDDQVFDGELKDELDTRFREYRYVCYSTASSTLTQPKFRVVFPLTRRVEAHEIKAFWFALVTASGLSADTQCKDLSRMYYVPADYNTSAHNHNFIFSGVGKLPLDIDDLMREFPAPPPKSNDFFDNLPKQIQQQIIDRRKGELTNTTVRWSSYRNCPFWPKKTANEYAMIVDSGWYRKMYQIMIQIAGFAVRDKYPITAREIAQLCFEFDADTGGWYKDRQFETEANSALEFVYTKMR